MVIRIVNQKRELKRQKKAHPDRNRKPEVQIKEFESLLAGDNGIVVIKTDLEDPNPALRDFVAFRIVDNPHPLQKSKYRLWPLYNFAVAIDDYRLGITHVLRGKDHLNNTEKQKWIYKYMGWNEPEFIHYGLVSIPKTNLKTSKIRQSILDGEYTGWDDCRIATIKALARRGYSSETFSKYWEASGVKEVDIKFSWQNFDAMNKDLIDAKSKRLFFVSDPKEFISELVNEAILKLSDKNLNLDEKAEFIKIIAVENIDIDALGLYTLGELRKSSSQDDISKYQESFEKYFLKSLTSRLTDYSSSEFKIIGKDKKSANYTIINSKISPSDGGPEIKIDWRVYTKNPDKPLIRDLIVEGLSLARTQKEEFASILSSNNNEIQKLINKLDEFANKK